MLVPLLLPRAAKAELPLEPLPWQDAAPLAVPFLELPFESPRTVPPRQLELRFRTYYSNNIASAQSQQVLVYYHDETAQPSLVLRYGLFEGLELHLEAAAVAEGVAYLDPVIQEVEGFFHTENKLRKAALSRYPKFVLVRPGGQGSRFSGPQAAFGDLWVGAKGIFFEQVDHHLTFAWRAAAKLPTGRFPFGSGVLEGGAGLLASYEPGPTHAWLVADLMVPFGSVSRARLETRPHPAIQAAVGRDLGERVSLLVQGSAHGSALRYLHLSEIDGWTFYLLVGARATCTRSMTAGLGVVENLFVTERGTDIAAVLDVTWQF